MVPTEINLKRHKECYSMCIDRTTLVDFFEDVETTEKYDGYFCSIAEVIGTVVLGSLCGFKNVRQDPLLGGKCAYKGIFEGEVPNRAYSVLLLDAGASENG